VSASTAVVVAVSVAKAVAVVVVVTMAVEMAMAMAVAVAVVVAVGSGMVIFERFLHAKTLIPRYLHTFLGSQNTNKHDLGRKWTHNMASDVTLFKRQCPREGDLGH
jgi:hypothetical protein